MEISKQLGLGAFEESFPTGEESFTHYHNFIDEFEEATGKRILGGWQGETVPDEEIAPDTKLSKEEYLDELMAVVFDAQAGTVIGDDWILHNPGTDGYETKLKYCEVLAYNAGANAWSEWLLDLTEIGNDEEFEAFMDEAEHFYHEQFFETIRGIREEEQETEEE